MSSEYLARRAYERFFGDGPPGVHALHTWTLLVGVMGDVIADEWDQQRITDGIPEHDRWVADMIRWMTDADRQKERGPQHPPRVEDHAP